MSNKPPVPTEAQLLSAYRALQSGRAVSVHDWILFSQWTRFDPRLAEVWILAFDRDWKTLSPVLFRDENRKASSPAVLGVLLDQYHQFLCPKTEVTSLGYWMKIALEGAPKANNESFLIGVQGFANQRVFDDADRPVRSFKHWGFFGREIFINKFQQKQAVLQKTAIAATERKKILIGLLKLKKRITVGEYRLACNDLISKRVAQLDLENFKGLKRVGNTRSRFYVLETLTSKKEHR